jgi:hypothetical protein
MLASAVLVLGILVLVGIAYSYYWYSPKLSHLRSGEPAAAGRSCDRPSWVGHGRGADAVMHRL